MVLPLLASFFWLPLLANATFAGTTSIFSEWLLWTQGGVVRGSPPPDPTLGCGAYAIVGKPCDGLYDRCPGLPHLLRLVLGYTLRSPKGRPARLVEAVFATKPGLNS